MLAAGKLWKIQLDTYEREVERYGGFEGLLAAEDIFWADSEAVMRILQSLQGDEGLDSRWRIALLGSDLLLTDCGFTLDEKRGLMERQRDAFEREFGGGTHSRKPLGDRFRKERRNLEMLFQDSSSSSGEIEVAKSAFRRRSVLVRDAAQRLRALAERRDLQTEIQELALSYIHMHINRLVRSAGRAHERVLYDFLFRIYDAQHARSDSRRPMDASLEVVTA